MFFSWFYRFDDEISRMTYFEGIWAHSVCNMMHNCYFKLNFHRCEFNNSLDTSCDVQVESHDQIVYVKLCIIVFKIDSLIGSNSTILLVIVVAVVVNNGFTLLCM